LKIAPGQTAVVTGAASGIGLGICRALSARGVNLVLSDIEQGPLELAATEMRDKGVETLSVRCDVRDWDAVHDLERQATSRFGPIDLVFNNAGIFGGLAPIWELDRLDWSWNLEVNLWGVINGVAAFVPAMVQRNDGHVVNTASMAGLSAIPFNGAYNVAKHGVVALSETLRAELDLKAPNVGVTVVCPGRVATNIQSARRNRPKELTPQGVGDKLGAVFLDTTEGFQKAIELGAIQVPSPGSAPPEELTGDEFGQKVLTYIEVDRLHMVMEASSRAGARARIDRLTEDLHD
jgi:NAD(P)-dependent dehydrogenase (short-subunit alcohol dehydrogenase family)